MNVEQLLNGVKDGSIVLPDFQRSFIWEPEDVRELIVSILGDFFIGSMLTLDSLKHKAMFALKLLEGVPEVNKSAEVQTMVKILLDGQQRATAILYALEQPDLPLKNRKNPYKTYINLEQALSGNWDAAVQIVNIADKKTMNKIRGDANNISFSLLKDIGSLVEKFKDDRRLSKIVTLANDFMHREINIVKLPENTTADKIVETFERVNRTGQPLCLFDLVTARLYKHKIKLRDLWQSTQEDYEFAKFVHPEYVLRVVSLLREKGTKRQVLLDLSPTNFREDWRRASTSLEIAYKRATSLKKGYGVFEFSKWIPYLTDLTPVTPPSIKLVPKVM